MYFRILYVISSAVVIGMLLISNAQQKEQISGLKNDLVKSKDRSFKNYTMYMDKRSDSIEMQSKYEECLLRTADRQSEITRLENLCGERCDKLQ